MTKKPSNDLVRELCQIQTPQDLTDWKKHHQVTVHLIDEAMVEVRRLLDSAAFDLAGRLSEWCILLSQEFTDPLIRARTTVTKGIALGRANDDAKALPYFDEALRLYEEAGDEVLAAKVRTNRIMCYCHLGRYEDALRDGEMNNDVLSRLGEKRLLARNYNNLGEVLFRLDRFQEWLATLERAEGLLQEIGDQESLAMVYMNHAVVLTSLNRPFEAFGYYHLSKQLAQETGQTYIAAVCNYNLGYLHYIRGEYTQALDILNETRNALPTDQWYVPLCDLTQSEIYLEMNMYREAARLAQAAYDAFEATEKPFEMAKALGVMAIARSQLREFKEAGALFERAKTMFQAQGNDVRAAGMDLYRGLMWLQLGRYSEARKVAQHACEAFAKENVKPKAAFARVVSARASLKLAEIDAASHDATAATSIHQESPAPWVGHQLHAILGEIHLAQDDLENARIEFRQAIGELESVRANIAPDELRLNYLKDKVPVYEMLLNTDLRVGDPASIREAFETGERAKSRTLVDLLAGSIDSLRQVTSSSVEDIQQVLPSDAALVEYFMSGNDVMAFCLAPGRFDVVQRICPRDELRKRFEFLQFHIARLTADPAAIEMRATMALLNIQDHLAELYKMLVAPLDAFLADRKSVVFVPFDFLHYLPFHALYDGSTYLTDRFTISYAPTATIYRLFRPREVDVGGPALLIGVPDAAAPFITDEIGSIRSVLPNARTFVGPAATRQRVTREMTSASLIHIASHASFRPDNPMFSSIQLHDTSLNFFDIYNLRTSASLITLSGCGTGLSSVVAGDELLGLVRGFLYAGATSVVISLWDVNDRTTADLMKYFYGNLAEGQSKSQSLRQAMSRLREEHPHPYHWAPFLLMGDPS
jgi:CHAT domain-containing protein/tetratricopeptide (TPR) repeat protein